MLTEEEVAQAVVDDIEEMLDRDDLTDEEFLAEVRRRLLMPDALIILAHPVGGVQ